GVKLPNNSVPSSINPLRLRSSTSHASSLPAAVHERCSAVPSAFRSKSTPSERLLRLNPSPPGSITIGHSAAHVHVSSSKPSPNAKHFARREGLHGRAGGRLQV